MEATKRDATAAKHAEQLPRYNTVIANHSDATVLVGDSVLERLEWFSKKKFPTHVALLAKGGDKTEHLLWRLENTPKSDKVKKVILHIGTNNIKAKVPAVKIADAIAATVQAAQKVWPQAQILLIPLYHREDVPAAQISAINALLADTYEASSSVLLLRDFWVDIAPKYDRAIYVDHVHLNLAANDKFYAELQSLM